MFEKEKQVTLTPVREIIFSSYPEKSQNATQLVQYKSRENCTRRAQFLDKVQKLAMASLKLALLFCCASLALAGKHHSSGQCYAVSIFSPITILYFEFSKSK